MKRATLFILLLFVFGELAAKEIAGVTLEETVHSALSGSTLTLNGAGLREKFFVDVYLGALYLPSANSDANHVIMQKIPKQIRMHMLYSEVDKEKFVDGWNEGFAANQSEQTLTALKDRIDTFNSMFETLVKGDTVVLDYAPGKGTEVTIKGSSKGVIPGADFNQALMSIWLGKKPVTKSLKNDLLGN